MNTGIIIIILIVLLLLYFNNKCNNEYYTDNKEKLIFDTRYYAEKNKDIKKLFWKPEYDKEYENVFYQKCNALPESMPDDYLPETLPIELAKNLLNHWNSIGNSTNKEHRYCFQNCPITPNEYDCSKSKIPQEHK